MTVWFITGASRGFGLEPGPFRTNFLDGTSLAFAGAEIDDYAATAGAARSWAAETNYTQQGDPEKAAQIIVDLAGRDDLPERIQLGSKAFDDVAAKLARTARDQEAWRAVSVSADFAEVGAPE